MGRERTRASAAHWRRCGCMPKITPKQYFLRVIESSPITLPLRRSTQGRHARSASPNVLLMCSPTETQGVIGEPGFKLITRWLESERFVPTRRQGAFLTSAHGEFLIPEPLFSAIELAQRFDASTVELPDHWRALADFRRLIDPDSSDSDSRPRMSDFLRKLRVYTGAALSLALCQDANGEVDFDPVLFDADAITRAAEEGQSLTGLLPDQQLQIFQTTPKDWVSGFQSCQAKLPVGQQYLPHR